ncbi:hypothetical protein ACH4EC_24470 [Streptomyces anulatus]|uniref:hypothetical protein n=1 Tax=Streptomyces sp. or3 TaxID=1828020 RepID=UPI000BFC9DC7|nr:hypothetical protein [Streptomyces sp. or3]
MSTQIQTPQTETTEYHYVTTIQMPGAVINTRSGILTLPPGFTRANAYGYLMDQLKDEYQTTISVLYFALEPNQL